MNKQQNTIQFSKNKRQLLYQTSVHFNIYNRCVDNKGLPAFRIGENACAIGRELTNLEAKKLDKTNCSVNNKEVYYLLPVRLRNMGLNFLYDIQILHDRKKNWNENGLSKIGEENIKKICEKYYFDRETLKYY